MPETAAEIARTRMRAVDSGRVITGCASSLMALRRAATPDVAVEDIASVVARAVRR
jgi:hypothetical protein